VQEPGSCTDCLPRILPSTIPEASEISVRRPPCRTVRPPGNSPQPRETLPPCLREAVALRWDAIASFFSGWPLDTRHDQRAVRFEGDERSAQIVQLLHGARHRLTLTTMDPISPRPRLRSQTTMSMTAPTIGVAVLPNLTAEDFKASASPLLDT
jgi:hypothetical protein